MNMNYTGLCLFLFFQLRLTFVLSVDEEVDFLLDDLANLKDQVARKTSLVEPSERLELSKGFKQCHELAQKLYTLEKYMELCVVIAQREQADIEMFDQIFKLRSDDFHSAVKEFKGDIPAMYNSKKHDLSRSVQRTQIEANELAKHECCKLLADTAWRCMEESYGFIQENLIRFAMSVKDDYMDLHYAIQDKVEAHFKANLPKLVGNGFLSGETIDFDLSSDYSVARNFVNQHVWRSLNVTKPSVFYSQASYLLGTNTLRVRFTHDETKPGVAMYVAKEPFSELTFPKFYNHHQFRCMVYDLFRYANIMGHDLVLVDLTACCYPEVLSLGVITETFKFFQEAFCMDPSIYKYPLTKVQVRLTFDYLGDYNKRVAKLAGIR